MNQVQIIDKVAFIYIKNNKLLSARSINKTAFYTPGGKREKNESDIECLTRELKEELNVDFIAISANHYGDFQAHAHGKDMSIVVKMKCYFGEFKGELLPSSEIEEIKWLDSNDIGKDYTSKVDWLILAQLKVDGKIL
ncbi:MAG: NUDIX domain-containing protein [Candidatus Dojkabacteria bacterium]|nr:NUDIX domain-containing protein [Candidatus Dojkabacteria bacterium]MDQ7021051.1 NUDIX domain-containing protein [Candidatus Dojkabacteria bacterium]